jgi:hypothetical protein
MPYDRLPIGAERCLLTVHGGLKQRGLLDLVDGGEPSHLPWRTETHIEMPFEVMASILLT